MYPYMFRFFICCACLVFLYYSALHAFRNRWISKRGFSFWNSLEKFRATSLRVSILSMAETTLATITKCFFVIGCSFYMVISGFGLFRPAWDHFNRDHFFCQPHRTGAKAKVGMEVATPTYAYMICLFFLYWISRWWDYHRSRGLSRGDFTIWFYLVDIGIIVYGHLGMIFDTSHIIITYLFVLSIYTSIF